MSAVDRILALVGWVLFVFGVFTGNVLVVAASGVLILLDAIERRR